MGFKRLLMLLLLTTHLLPLLVWLTSRLVLQHPSHVYLAIQYFWRHFHFSEVNDEQISYVLRYYILFFK